MHVTKRTPSKRPNATKCRGISVNGKPCQRSVVKGVTDADGNQFCYSHRAQANNTDIFNIRKSKESVHADSDSDWEVQSKAVGDNPDNDGSDDDGDIGFFSKTIRKKVPRIVENNPEDSLAQLTENMQTLALRKKDPHIVEDDFENDTEDSLGQLTENMQTLALATPQRTKQPKSNGPGRRKKTATPERSAVPNINGTNVPQQSTTVIVIYSGDSTPAEITVSGKHQPQIIRSPITPTQAGTRDVSQTSNVSPQRTPYSGSRGPTEQQDYADGMDLSSFQEPSTSNANVNKPLPATPLAEPNLSTASPPPATNYEPTSSASPPTAAQKPFSFINRHYATAPTTPEKRDNDNSSIKGFVNNLKSFLNHPRKSHSSTVPQGQKPFPPSSPSSSDSLSPSPSPSPSTSVVPHRPQQPPITYSNSDDEYSFPSPYTVANQLRTHSSPTLPRMPSPPTHSRLGQRDTTPSGKASLRCQGFSKKGTRCTNKVKIDESNEDGALPYCHHHRSEAVREKLVFVGKEIKLKWVHVDEWISPGLSEKTRYLLRMEMEKPISPSDDAGFIYAYQLLDGPSSSTDTYCLYKVGRTTNLHRRLHQWSQQCGYTPKLIEHFPTTASYPQPNLRSSPMPSPSPSPSSSSSTSSTSDLDSGPVIKCKHSHRAERLIHLELFDKHRADLNTCKGCGNIHREWFKVERRTPLDSAGVGGVKGERVQNLEGWEDIKLIILRWVTYIETVYGVGS
ncbi:meiotically up-regulated gene 113-domain-containing protein [Jimgerdemannia flammicorona]|uniref:Meiotically up-regulated gene 113-domain-containing protein n=1 Tax=Jimgerdemannia flammicorona TaxID=994334 RepID=A0A433QVD6_9FUNG|nr:meiotically up-regulated gene 113-domain-containing protein [Jimgerdemannia flammicorona]